MIISPRKKYWQFMVISIKTMMEKLILKNLVANLKLHNLFWTKYKEKTKLNGDYNINLL